MKDLIQVIACPQKVYAVYADKDKQGKISFFKSSVLFFGLFKTKNYSDVLTPDDWQVLPLDIIEGGCEEAASSSNFLGLEVEGDKEDTDWQKDAEDYYKIRQG